MTAKKIRKTTRVLHVPSFVQGNAKSDAADKRKHEFSHILSSITKQNKIANRSAPKTCLIVLKIYVKKRVRALLQGEKKIRKCTRKQKRNCVPYEPCLF